MKLTLILIEPRYPGYYSWEMNHQPPDCHGFVSIRKSVFWSEGLTPYNCLRETQPKRK